MGEGRAGKTSLFRALRNLPFLDTDSTAGVEIATWTTCRADPAQAAEVQADFEDGAKLGVNGTPAFFVNGILLSGAQPFSAFKEIIDRELSAE